MIKTFSKLFVVFVFLGVFPSVVSAARLDISSPKDPMSLLDVQTEVLDRLSFRQEIFTNLRTRMSRDPNISAENKRVLMSRADSVQKSLENSKLVVRNVESVNAIKNEVFGRESGITRFYSQVPIEHGLFINYQLQELFDDQEHTLSRLNETIIRIESDGNDVSALVNLKANLDDLLKQLADRNSNIDKTVQEDNAPALHQQITDTKQLILQMRGVWTNLKTEAERFL